MINKDDTKNVERKFSKVCKLNLLSYDMDHKLDNFFNIRKLRNKGSWNYIALQELINRISIKLKIESYRIIRNSRWNIIILKDNLVMINNKVDDNLINIIIKSDRSLISIINIYLNINSLAAENRLKK